uniref:BURP domain-containing protein n=1 Tax=Leersia perrieri TaxID=77586 RepID=A0A0D9WPL3_9ORYZ
MVAGEGRKLLSAEEMIRMVPGPRADVTKYQKNVLPNSPIPSAIIDLFTPPSGKRKKELSFLKWGSGAKGAELDPELDQAKKKISRYNYGTSSNGHDRVHHDGHGDNRMVFNYEAVKLKMESLDTFWYSEINKNKFPHYRADGHDLLAKKFSRHIYSNQADQHNHLHYDNHDDNQMASIDEAMNLKKLDQAKKIISRYIYGNPVDGHDQVHVAKKKVSLYIYGNPTDGHDQAHRVGNSDNHIVFSEEAFKLTKKSSDLHHYSHSRLKEIGEKPKVDLDNRKFARYIYGNPANRPDYVHLAKKKFLHYIYGHPTDGYDHVHNEAKKGQVRFVINWSEGEERG